MVLGGITVACLSNIISILQNVDAVVSMHELINALYFTIHVPRVFKCFHPLDTGFFQTPANSFPGKNDSNKQTASCCALLYRKL